MKNWAILFVRTGREERLIRALGQELNACEWLPFLPTKEATHRNKGVFRTERRLLFPGYVFIQTETDANRIASRLRSCLLDTVSRESIYSILHYGDNKSDVAVRDHERAYWERLFDADFCVTGSVGFIEGDVTRIISGPLVGMEGRIKWINRRKREAVVEMDVMGSVREVRVMLEVVEKLT